MGEHCGCGDRELAAADVQERPLDDDRQTRYNRHLFERRGIFVVSLMGSPGSGKTGVLEAMARVLGGGERLAALSVEPTGDHDALRLEKVGILASTIDAGPDGRLDADLVYRALRRLPRREIDFLFVENPGTVVGSEVRDFGQAVNVASLAVTEGDDGPLEHPPLFEQADLVLLTKVDLLPRLVGVRTTAIRNNLARLRPEPQVVEISSVSGQGVGAWIAWLEDQRLEWISPELADGVS